MNPEQRMEAICREIFSQVRTSVVMRMRFLDMAVFRLKPVPAPLHLATDGNYLYYRPVWLLKRYQNETGSVTRDYMHVLLHCVFRHPFVSTLVDHELWDLSCDIAAEAMITDFHQPMLSVKAEVRRGAVISQLQANVPQMTAEKLYHYFQSHPPKPEWAELFRADDHEIWYDRQERQTLQRQARQNRQPERQEEESGEGPDQEEKRKNNSSENDPEDQDGQNGSSSDDDPENQDGQGRGSSGNDPENGENRGNDSSDGNPDSGPEQTDGDTGIGDEWKDISEHVQMDLEAFAKEQGYQAGNLEQLLAAVNREKYDYEAFLKKFAVMGEVMKINDDEFDYIFYTYGLKLYKNMPLIEPLEYKEVKRIRDFVIAIDTSGSTSGKLVQRFLTKTYNILESTESFFSKVNIFLIQCDAEIQEVVRITKKEEFEDYLRRMTVKGLGGTDFRPVFAYVDQLIRNHAFANLKGLIYFTDGYGTFPVQKPDYQTAFVFIQDQYNRLNVPPWAMKLILDKDSLE